MKNDPEGDSEIIRAVLSLKAQGARPSPTKFQMELQMKNLTMEMLTLLSFERLQILSQEFSEGEVININEGSGCNEKDKMSHRKLSSKKCLDEVLKIDFVLKCEIRSRHRKGTYSIFIYKRRRRRVLFKLLNSFSYKEIRKYFYFNVSDFLITV